MSVGFAPMNLALRMTAVGPPAAVKLYRARFARPRPLRRLLRGLGLGDRPATRKSTHKKLSGLKNRLRIVGPSQIRVRVQRTSISVQHGGHGRLRAALFHFRLRDYEVKVPLSLQTSFSRSPEFTLNSAPQFRRARSVHCHTPPGLGLRQKIHQCS
jgi:hypothetical protein